jgi:hypothetical protein
MMRLCLGERFLQQLPLAEIHLAITANDQLRFRLAARNSSLCE